MTTCREINKCHWLICQEMGKCVLYTPASERMKYAPMGKRKPPSRPKEKNTRTCKTFKSIKTECFYCDKQLSESSRSIDHIHPISKGGKNNADNKVWACKDCNGSKDNLLLGEWLMVIRSKKGYSGTITDEKRLRIIDTIVYMLNFVKN